MTFEDLEKKINSGHATYADVLKYAQTTGRETGVELAQELQAALSENAEQYIQDVEEAGQIISPAMRGNHEKVVSATNRVQKQINERMGLGLNPVEPEYNASYENGLIYAAADPNKTETFWTNAFVQSVENMSMTTVDDALKANMDFQRKCGIRRRIRRYPVGNCCEWCRGLAGTYEYDSVSAAGNDVWRRHKNCNCVIEDIDDGQPRIVYNYRENNTPEGRATIERRKQTNIEKPDLSPRQRIAIANAAKEDGDLTRPGNIDEDLAEYKKLKIPDETRRGLQDIRGLADESGHEYGYAIHDGKKTEYQTDNNHADIRIKYPADATHIELYHAHTDDQPPSGTDLAAFINNKVEAIGVSSQNGDVWVVRINEGIRPEEKEFYEIQKMCYDEAAEAVQRDPRFSEWTYEERYYMLTLERMRRITNVFEWEVMKGEIL